mmetsp:Transcript_3272/g.6251  ORF Transcript_3272/g.6251 Transcript_3272/m.6251 type:complete len:145 (+) Transcript_3272:1399-1833(+)
MVIRKHAVSIAGAVFAFAALVPACVANQRAFVGLDEAGLDTGLFASGDDKAFRPGGEVYQDYKEGNKGFLWDDFLSETELSADEVLSAWAFGVVCSNLALGAFVLLPILILGCLFGGLQSLGDGAMAVYRMCTRQATSVEKKDQ